MYSLKTNACKTLRKSEAQRILGAMRRAAEIAGTSDITDEEINAEIAAARKERRIMGEI
ncbi:MAG: hypothetical protein FWE23_05300 [Chitinivibrionia bacterium]|nr:hypothetical protein [Chitinivibrionia bacterium]